MLHRFAAHHSLTFIWIRQTDPLPGNRAVASIEFRAGWRRDVGSVPAVGFELTTLAISRSMLYPIELRGDTFCPPQFARFLGRRVARKSRLINELRGRVAPGVVRCGASSSVLRQRGSRRARCRRCASSHCTAASAEMDSGRSGKDQAREWPSERRRQGGHTTLSLRESVKGGDVPVGSISSTSRTI